MPVTLEAAKRLLEQNPTLAASLQIKWTKYIPHSPTPKQMAFLVLPHEEAFYGGAAGGGKSDALLMAALQYVDVPGYAALLFRKTLSDLKLPGSLLSRAHNWLGFRNDCWWSASEHSYYFPTADEKGNPCTPSRIQFGYTGQMGGGLGSIGVKERYQCFHPATEMLTVNGWVAIADVTVGDLAATMCPVTREMVYRPVTKTHAYKFKGQLVEYFGRGGFAVTPNHELWIRTMRSETLRKVRAEDLPQNFGVAQFCRWEGLPAEPVSFSSDGHNGKTVSFTAEQWATFLGWYISEGNGWEGRWSVIITQVNEIGRSQIRKLFSSFDFKWFEDDHRFFFHNKSLLLWLNANCGRGAGNKKLPDSVKQWSPKYLRLILQSLVEGDGTWYTERKGHFVSSSKRLADDVCEIAVKAGFRATITERQGNSEDSPFGTKPRFHVCIFDLRERDSVSHVTQVTRPDYNGAVYCVTVPPHHTVLIRYRGRISWVGQSAEFQFVGFDELTQFMEDDYTWMFNRLRKAVCPVHKLDNKGRPIYLADCWWCQVYRSLPVRMRSASNPGNLGHAWVKSRFGIVGVTTDEGETSYIGTNPQRPYIPAFVVDNPYIDNEGYISNLDRMDAVTRDRLKKGDWGVSEDSRFKKHWVRYYSQRGHAYVLGRAGVGAPLTLEKDFQRVFVTVDPAGSSRESPGSDKIWKRQPSWTVIATWGLTHDFHLLWLDNERVMVEIPDIIDLLQKTYRKWRPAKIKIEASGLGKGVFQLALKYGLPAEAIHPQSDKLVRATDAMVRMEQGRIWLPEPPGPAWLEPVESELFTWTGDPLMTDDIIDVLAYAAMDVSWEAAAVEVVERQIEQGIRPDDNIPGIIHQAPFFGTVPGIGFSDPNLDGW